MVSAAKIQLIREKIEICGNYLNFLQFQNSKENSFCGNYMRNYGIHFDPVNILDRFENIE